MARETFECRKCGESKPLSDFPPSRAYRERERCRACGNAQTQAWRAANPDRVKEYAAEWREKNRVQIAAYDRRHHLKSSYGLTPEQYDAMLATQGGRCAGCGGTDPRNKRYGQFVVDHDHATGAVRGLLCNPCNVAIGQVNDDIDRLMSLAAYLMQHQDVLSLNVKEN